MAQKLKRGSPVFKDQSKFTHQDSMELLQDIGVHLNSIPGSRKDWKDWRKVSPPAYSI
jgi:hypothetical protein